LKPGNKHPLKPTNEDALQKANVKKRSKYLMDLANEKTESLTNFEDTNSTINPIMIRISNQPNCK
jgi:hypothetical protein